MERGIIDATIPMLRVWKIHVLNSTVSIRCWTGGDSDHCRDLRSDRLEGGPMFGQRKEEGLKTVLELPRGILAHATFWRLFRRQNPEQFQVGVSRRITAVSQVTEGHVVAIDGKAMRRSLDKGLGRGAISMVSAWASANRLVLGQQNVDETANEITAIPKRLPLLLKGCLVTIDALGWQTEIAQTIVEQGADDLLALKKNQENLDEDVVLLFDDLQQSHFRASPHDHATTVIEAASKGVTPERLQTPTAFVACEVLTTDHTSVPWSTCAPSGGSDLTSPSRVGIFFLRPSRRQTPSPC